MKTSRRQALPAILCGVALALMIVSAQGGTDILHFAVGEPMAVRIGFGAAGQLQASENDQGNGGHQSLDIFVNGLASYNTYNVYEVEGTNLIPITAFVTDPVGAATVHLRKNNSGNGHVGKKMSALPEAVSPVSRIENLAIFQNSSTGGGVTMTGFPPLPLPGLNLSDAILTADLTAPESLQYLIKRDLSTNNIDANLRIKATTSQVQFRLLAGGLNPTNDYFLVFNGEIVQTNSTDLKGSLKIDSFPSSVTNVLDVRELALWDSASNVVLSTELP